MIKFQYKYHNNQESSFENVICKFHFIFGLNVLSYTVDVVLTPSYWHQIGDMPLSEQMVIQ